MDKNHIDAHQRWVANKVASFDTGINRIHTKVGLIGASSGIGQAAQGVAAAVIPGDLSNVRSPVRSALWSALTPGGIRKPSIRRALTQEREYRCPEGYQYGGRFTDSKWSTCGRQLFDLPSIFASLMRIADAAARADNLLEADGEQNILRGQDIGGSILQSRTPQIPRVGPMSQRSRQSTTAEAITSLTSNSSVPYMMVRRDGFPMMPVVSVAELRKVPDNRNMEDAVFLMQAANIDSFGSDELGLLSNTGVTSLVYVLPSGATVRMDRTRPLSVGERRKLGKTVSSASQIDNSKNPLARLEAVVADSGGAISLNTDFSRLRNPDAPISSGKNSGMPRWTIDGFKPAKGRSAGRAPSAPESQASDDRREALSGNRRITDIETAIEHINRGGNLSDIDPAVLVEAIDRVRLYHRRNLGNNRRLYARSDGGISFVKYESYEDFESLGAHVTSEVQRHLGLPAPNVRLVGEGVRRPYLVESGPSLSPDGGAVQKPQLSSLPGSDLGVLVIADYLTDTRRRNPASLIGVSVANRQRVLAETSVPSALAGLSPEEIRRRFALDLPSYLTRDASAIAKEMRNRNEAVRRQILAIYESLLLRARQFEWDTYLSRLRADGNLSTAERRHMEIIRAIYEQRLKKLGQSTESFRKFLDL